jgi:hypothetical protein
MKILRFLLCHLLSITLLVSCILLFLSRDTLKEDFNRLTGRVSQPAINNVAADSSLATVKQDEISPAAGGTATAPDHPEEITVVADVNDIPDNTAPVVEPGPVVEPVIAESEQKAENDEAMQPESDVKSQLKSEDPWDTVLAGVKEGQVATSEFGSDIQADPEPVAESTSTASFPPENYDPESSSSDASNHADSAIASPGFPITERQSFSAGQASENVPFIQENAPVQELVSTRENVTNGQLAADQAYYAALEEARRMHWDGNAKSAQAAFERLMIEYPEMPEAPADLGNLFLQQGNREGAIWAYQNAIPRYLNLHREQEAINLTRFVSQYDPAIAESLQKKYW